ncbi:MAG: TPM domain-containing protein [Bacteroidota bacterium]
MPNLKHFVLLSICLVIFACKSPPAKQDLLRSIPDPKTLNESYVSNPDGLFTEATVAELNGKLGPLDQSGVAHIDVVFVKSIGENVPKDIAHQLFNNWKIGDKQKNNGLLILMVKDQKRMEFETGYGLEGVLPDITCYNIQQQYMIPAAKEGDFDLAIQNGVDAIINVLHTDGKNAPVTTATPDTTAANSSPAPVIARPDAVQTEQSSTDTTVSGSDIVAPYAEAVPQDTVAAPSPDNKQPGRIWSLISLIILIIYYTLAKFVSARLVVNGKKPVANPVFWLLVIVPTAGVILLNLYFPIAWIELRAVIVLYIFLTIYVQIHYMIVNRRLTRAASGLTNHEQYLKWQDNYAHMEWALWVFPYPFFKFYWNAYQARQKALRDAPVACSNCSKVMARLNEEQDDSYLSKGQVAEEVLGSVDYDVWTCKACNEKMILDYSNLQSKATECPECHFKTLMYKSTTIVKRATTSYEGNGYTLSVCTYCNFNQKVPYTIPKISTSSSSSSSSGSSSSSSSSSSSGGSSGGGGAGSSW